MHIDHAAPGAAASLIAAFLPDRTTRERHGLARHPTLHGTSPGQMK